MNEFLDFLSRGGLIMVPIGAFSILALAVFVERIFTLRDGAVLPADLIDHVTRKVKDRRPLEALAQCEADRSSVAVVLSAGLRRHGRSRDTIKEAFEEKGRIEVNELSKRVELLGTIAAVTPLIGLLGTVVGMIDVFRTVVVEVGDTAGAVNPAQLADGIWAALLTTAAGLSVAIPAYLGYRYLQSRVDQLAVEMEETCLELLDEMVDEPSLTSEASVA